MSKYGIERERFLKRGNFRVFKKEVKQFIGAYTYHTERISK